jgi:hypothetical protein
LATILALKQIEGHIFPKEREGTHRDFWRVFEVLNRPSFGEKPKVRARELLKGDF